MKSLFNHSIPVAKKPGINIGGLPSESLRSTQAVAAVKVITEDEEVVEAIAPLEVTEDVVVEEIVPEVVIEEEVEVPVKKTRKPRAKKVEDEK